MNGSKKRHIFTFTAVAIAVTFLFGCFATACGVNKGADNAPAPAVSAEGNAEGGDLLLSGGETAAGRGDVSFTAAKIARENYDEYGVIPAAETAYTVTATVIGEDLTENQKGVTWSAPAFKNPSSGWALGLNASDYISAVPNGSQITISCLRAFGAQIVITATSAYNPYVSAQLTCDYQEKVSTEDIRFAGLNITYTTGLPQKDDINMQRTKIEAYKILTVHLANSSTKTLARGSATAGCWGEAVLKFNIDDFNISKTQGTIKNNCQEIKLTLKYDFEYSDWTMRPKEFRANRQSGSGNIIVSQYELLRLCDSSYHTDMTLGSTYDGNVEPSSYKNFVNFIKDRTAPITADLECVFEDGTVVDFSFYIKPEFEPE